MEGELKNYEKGIEVLYGILHEEGDILLEPFVTNLKRYRTSFLKSCNPQMGTLEADPRKYGYRIHFLQRFRINGEVK
ncbi:MAG: hypothetical protein IPL23_30605 [Saprospiraceae bacterium]|nr:hypothetical protein [Saprospiraceae bacterium]